MPTTFEEREKAFEKKFALDQDLRFKATVRRNKLLGLWAAEKLGMSKDEADAYAMDVVKTDFEKVGDEDIVGKLLADFTKNNIPHSVEHIQETMSNLMAKAVKQIEREAKTNLE